MTETKQLGVFWGTDTIYCVESTGITPTKTTMIPIPPLTGTQPGTDRASFLGAHIAKHLTQEHIAATDINIALPSSDIIFRSFMIPWMQPNEIKGVVEFEASKYIPFAMEELLYAFHPIQLTQEGIRRIRIIFTAIKKETIKQYIDPFERANISVATTEPSPLSIIRALSTKSLIDPKQTIALIEADAHQGKIIIIDQRIPLFVREFTLTQPEPPAAAIDLNGSINRIINEIRISIEYFNRQDPHLQVQQILFLAAQPEKLSTRLTEELHKPVIPISSRSLIPDITFETLNPLSAFGASIIGPAEQIANFDLAPKDKKKHHKKRQNTLSLTQFKSSIVTAGICIPLMIGSFVLSTMALTKPREQLAALDAKLGPFKDADVGKLALQKETKRTKLTYLKDIPTKSTLSSFLSILPTMLPQGTWIKTLTIQYVPEEKKLTPGQPPTPDTTKGTIPNAKNIVLTLEGYAYLENTNEQFKLINELLHNLNANAQFTETFKSIVLETVKTEELRGYTVTNFKIKCDRP